MEQQKNHGILIYTDYRDKVRRLTLEEAGRLFLAIMDYAADGTETEISPAADMCFSFIISQYERDQEKYKRICEKRAEAGRRGAAARAAALAAAEEAKAKQEQEQQKKPEPQEPPEPEKPPEQTQMEMEPPGEPEQEPEKPKRQKKPKKETFGEFVQMTAEEYNKLLSQYGQERTGRMITVLDNYKGATGKKYKDDYRAILNWVVQRVDEEFQKRGRGGDGAAGSFGASDGFRGY